MPFFLIASVFFFSLGFIMWVVWHMVNRGQLRIFEVEVEDYNLLKTTWWSGILLLGFCGLTCLVTHFLV